MNKVLICALVFLLLVTSAYAYHRNLRFVVRPDVNGDGCVNMLDVPHIAQHYGCKRGDECYSKKSDLNSDGTVNEKDIDVLKGFYEAGCGW